MQQRKKEKKKWNIQGQGSRIENICQLVYKLPFFLYMLPKRQDMQYLSTWDKDLYSK